MTTQTNFQCFQPSRVPSPCFVVDAAAVEANLQILERVQRESGAKILLALKAFSMWRLAPLVMQYLKGVCASGIIEAQLGREEFCRKGGEVHTFSAAYKEDDLKAILDISDHVVFNSFNQWQRFQPLVAAARAKRPDLRFGLRVNPEYSEGAKPIYDPCAPCSRLGIPLSQFDESTLEGISGIHFHTLCEQDFPPLARTLDVVEAHLGHLLPGMEWVNFGGGHHITRPDYQVDELIRRIKAFASKYDVQVYLEPGEAIAWQAGVMVAEVLDLTHNGMDLAILDTSATCHMPDVIEMPYRPEITGAGSPQDHEHTYRLGGMTCLAGDVIGDYSFPQPLKVGQRLIFEDMAYYTMVKTTTFNGIRLPAIAVWDSRSDELQVIREFGYEDFKHRLS